jgi:SSS family solute:Na+ symporter
MLAGILVGIAAVIYLTFVNKTMFGTFNVGLIGLGANLIVLAAGAAIERATGNPPPADTPEVTDEVAAIEMAAV